MTKANSGDENQEHGSAEPQTGRCVFTNILSFSILFGLSSLVTMSLSAYISSQVTALEKQFHLNSASTGLILSCNDIGFLCTVLFFSHFGKTGHIPRILSFVTVLFGLSGIMASMCYLLSPVYLPKLSGDASLNDSKKAGFTAPLCSDTMSSTDSCDGVSGEKHAGTGPSWPIWLLGCSMVIQGIAKSPRNPLSGTYIDDNTPIKTKTAFYLGISTTLNILGPAVSIVIGGFFRRLPVDLQDTLLTQYHPKWIGAWWLGFVVFGSLSILMAFPLLLFPKNMLSRPQQSQTEHKDSALESVKDLPCSIIRVFRRPIFMLTLAGFLCVIFTVGGAQAFESKYVEKQFMIPASKANIALGAQKFVSVIIGTFTGGVITSRLKLSIHGCLKMMIICLSISLCGHMIEFFLGCTTPFIKGFHDITGAITGDSLEGCNCDPMDFFPVCGGDGVTYFSPCFAGCQNQTESTYGGCSEVATGQTVAGLCPTDCPYFYYYIGENLISNIIGTMFVMPALFTLIRSVEDRDKTIALGIKSFLASLLGFLPAPIVYGIVVDSSCIIWEKTCGAYGACAQYDLEDLRYKLKSAEIGGFGACYIFVILAFIVSWKQGGGKRDEATTEKTMPAIKSENTRL